VLLVGCASDEEVPGALGTAQQALGVSGNEGVRAERGSEWRVSGRWLDTMTGLKEFSAASPKLSAYIETLATTKMDVLVEARGLDGRIATKLLPAYQGATVSPGAPLRIDLSPADVPVQSVGGVVQVSFLMRYSEAGVVKVAQAGGPRMHVTYNAGYSRAWGSSDNMLALGIAATQLQGGAAQAIIPIEVLNKATTFQSDPATDPVLGGKMLRIGQKEDGRFMDAAGAWTSLSSAQASLQYTGGGSYTWDNTFYNKVRTTASFPPGPPDPLPIPRDITTCFNLRPGFRDNGSEAYLAGGATPAALTRARIWSLDPLTPLVENVLTDANGCVKFTIKDQYNCFQAEIDSGLVGNGTSAFNVTTNNAVIRYGAGICYKPGILGGTPDKVTLGISGNSPTIRVMAVASRIATMPDNGFLITPAAPRRIEAEDGCPFTSGLDFRARRTDGTFLGYNGEACFDGATAYFGVALQPTTNVPLNFDTTQDKFVVGHELGHMQQSASVGSTAVAYPFFSPTGNPVPARPAACGCDRVVSANQYHCLNSREYSSAAQAEGWAHFYSSKVMNDPAAATQNFGYYKELRTEPTPGTVVVKLPPVATNAKAPVKWRNRNCPLAEHGTEWDWLTFLTNVHTTGANKLSIAEISDIYQRACFASGTRCTGSEISWDTTTPQIDTNARKPLRPAAQAKFGGSTTALKYLQWVTQADSNGVSNNLAP
jgi:hypothetical protein